MNELIKNLEKIHTTKLGEERIKKNLQINEDVIEYCKKKIGESDTKINRQGKNYYVETLDCIITIHACRYTVITAHLKR